MCAFSCWNYGSPWRLSRFALFVFTFCLLSGTIVSSRSDNNGCSAVKNIWKSKGFGESQQVPPSPIQADHLSVCGASTSTTCCTRQMESKLTTHSRQQFASLLSDKLNGIRAGFQTRSSAFEDFCTELVEKSGRELHNMFTRTYGIIYQQNSHVFSELFRDLRGYFRGDDHDLSDVLDAFFSSLLLRMFTLLNGQYVFDERYLGCISERSQELTPFGDVPHKIGLQVKRAFVAARTFRHGLVVASDVISSLSKMELSSSCQKAITRMLYCPYCRGVTSGIRPCSGMCLNVVRGCLAHHPEFNTAWSGFIESMLKVADRLDGPFSIENVLEPMDVKISEAIMNFQENAEAVTSKVFQVCGQPNLGVRSKRNVETGKKRKGSRTTTAMPPRNASTTTVGFQAAGGQGSSSEDTSRAAPSGRRPAQNRTSTVSTTPAAAIAVNKTGDLPRVPLVATDDVTESSIMKSLDSTAMSTTSSVGVVRQSASNGTIPSVTLGRVVDRVRPGTTSTPMPTTSTSTTVPTTRSTSTTAATTTTTRRSAQVATTVAIRRSVKTTTKMPVVAGRRRGGSRGTPRTPAAAVPSSGRDDVRSSEGRSGAGSETSHTALERMMLEIRSTLTDSQGFLTAVPERMCAGVAAPPSEETRCWNGTSRSRYTAVVVDMATDSQQNNREVQLDTRRTSIIINQAVLQLKHIADKLKKAYNGDSVDWSDDGESDDEDAGIEGDDEDGYDNEGSGSGNGEMETRPTRNRYEGSGSMGGVPQRKPQPPYQGIRNMDERPHDTISRQHHDYPYNMPSTRRPLPPIFVVPTTSPKRIVYVTSRPKATQRLYVPNSAPTSSTSVNHLVPFVVGIFGFVNVTIRLRWYCW